MFVVRAFESAVPNLTRCCLSTRVSVHSLWLFYQHEVPGGVAGAAKVYDQDPGIHSWPVQVLVEPVKKCQNGVLCRSAFAICELHGVLMFSCLSAQSLGNNRLSILARY